MTLKVIVLSLVLVSNTKSKISTKSSSIREEKPNNNRNFGIRVRPIFFDQVGHETMPNGFFCTF